MQGERSGIGHKHQKTLERIFAEPMRANVVWKDVERLLVALGAEVTEGSGSRVRIALNGVRAVFHRPHSRKEISKSELKDVRRFLINSGVKQ